MIDSLKLNEVRTVYDTQNPKIGSIVSDAVEEKDSDTLFPPVSYTHLDVYKRQLLAHS